MLMISYIRIRRIKLETIVYDIRRTIQGMYWTRYVVKMSDERKRIDHRKVK